MEKCKECAEMQEQINVVTTILEKLTKMVKDNREFIGNNAETIKKTAGLLKTMTNLVTTDK
tara:strand:- start:789 stop:971 length:183 start_codon:yes stop_codon:yes gene_type:complete